MHVTEHGQELLTSGAPYNLQWFFTAEDETRTFDIAYTVTGAAIGTPDVAELYWKWVGEDHPTIGLVTATLHVPPGAGRLRAWGHGPLTGTVQRRRRHRPLAGAGRAAGDVRGGSGRDPAGPPAGVADHPAAEAPADPAGGAVLGPRRQRRSAPAPRATRARERDARAALTVVVPIVTLAGLIVFLVLWRRFGKEPTPTEDDRRVLPGPPRRPARGRATA